MRSWSEVATPCQGMPSAHTGPAISPFLLGAAIFAAALNLRPVLSSLGPVLPEVIADTGISATTASILTMVPTFCLGAFGLVAPRLAARLGSERTVVVSLVLLAAGALLRAVPDYLALLLGTIAAGAAIGVVGVLIPALIKRDFPDRTGPMMSVYTMMLCAGASLGAGASVPLAEGLGGWPAGLAFWAAPASLAALAWVPVLRRSHAPGGIRKAGGFLWRSRLAWCVTLFMGLQSSLAYIVFGWLAPILRARGFGAVDAGLIVSGSIMVQVLGALFVPILAARHRSQSGYVVAVTAMTLLGLLGCLYGPPVLAIIASGLLGIGQGGSMALALTIIVLRARDAGTAAELSGMSQSVGYTLASAGPLAVGLIRDLTGAWSAVGPFIVAIALLTALFGWAAGRDRHVSG
jgi:CP family cyanate transporter-like MFS transporter